LYFQALTSRTYSSIFSGEREEGDQASGTIYVLRSRSDNPAVEEHREVLHKIGVTNMKVEKRIAGARLQPTYLMADVEIVATYELFNVNCGKLEKLIHRFFSDVTLDIEVPDRFGNPVRPREWFLVPLSVIDRVVELIKARTITQYRYEASTASVIKA